MIPPPVFLPTPMPLHRFVKPPAPAPFWLVYGPKSVSLPRAEFGTRAEADARAATLATTYPGSEFFVLGAVSRVRTPIGPPLDIQEYA